LSDAVKWALLVAGAIVIIGMVVSLDYMEYLDFGTFGSAVSSVISIVGEGFNFGRGIINNLLSPWARVALSGLMYWIIGKELILWSIKVSVWVYHFIFK